MLRSTDHFTGMKDEPAIKYEKGGGELLARLIKPDLTASINKVERKQGRFPDAVIVYIPKNIDRFSNYCASARPSACVIGDRLFMSPRLLQQKQRIPAVLTHELSHLQLTQVLGKWNYQTRLPIWFKEGLAVFISNGSGVENVDKNKAVNAILQGKTMEPNAKGSLFFRKTASSFGLKPHMFYRQSSLYVEWLYSLNQVKFKRFINLLKDGLTLNQAMQKEYGFDVKAGWGKFINELKRSKANYVNAGASGLNKPTLALQFPLSSISMESV